MPIRDRLGSADARMGRYEVFQTGFRISAIANVILAVTTVISLSMAWWVFTSTPEPRYFATREDGGIIPLVAVSQPFLNDGQITNFAVEAVTSVMTMDFVNWRDDLLRSSDFFQRPQGWDNFLAAIEDAGIIDFIQQRRMVSTAVANGAVIVRRGVDGSGRFSWTLQIPLSVTYESATERSTERMLAEVVVSRVPTWQSARGVGITRITFRAGRG